MSLHVRLSRLNLRLGAAPGHAQKIIRTQIRCHHHYELNHFVQRAPAETTAVGSKPGTTSFRLAVKDNFATKDLPTTCASSILAGYSSPFEATIVRQLRDRGAVVVGKTNMDEFGMGSHSTHSSHGPVLNPLSEVPPTSAGGSSGGSAVAVRVGDADIALGTDTGGSIRLPAAYCGVVGYKPSYGMLSRWGVVPYANSLDTVGLFARDATAIENLVFGTKLDEEHDPNDPTSLSTNFRTSHRTRQQQQQQQQQQEKGPIRVGVPLEYNIEELDPLIRTAWSDAANVLSDAGVEIVPVSLPSTRQALAAYYVIAPAEASSNLAKYDGVRYGVRGEESDAAGEVLYSKTRGDGFGDEVKRRILLGSYSLSSEAMDNYFIQAQKVRRLVQRDFDRVFRIENPLYDAQQFDLSDMSDNVRLEDKLGPSQVDFLLCPTAPTFAPRMQDLETQTPVEVYMNDVFTVPASLAGLPAVSIPVTIRSPAPDADESRKVAGLQLIGQYWDDRRLLNMAADLSSRLATSS
ncbi:glutamyl-tRNA amidotransferase subunit A [Sodiomyces alkalinus F11]|uniref:Glutamyl-tRNA(Gln) amidotransferase subunit A, mitochondrial n=1 Tax=Sodiomyces alkalinus (strain CBS 110278 / VKM F-3762 / F11) TaxID=1314773 RepID=A0A3N2Q2P5_SODAK|nr:glutamyl-tRNA amidotransferase subunit A [Sodiomyces alkalinus F11]ROT40996.1 glutamyl-tRNA amidotransferase subunit A [Sodiomyces alkalinus F11]